MLQNGAALSLLTGRIHPTIVAARKVGDLAGHAADLAAHVAETETVTRTLMPEVARDPQRALANATIYLDMFGHVVVAWMWLRQALVAAELLEKGEGDPDFLNGKIAACRYFFAYELPKARVQRDLLMTLDDTTLSMKDAWF